MRQAYAGSNYRVRHVQSAVHDAHLPFTGMQLKVFVREPSEDVPQCRDTYPGKNGKRYEVIPIHAPAWGATCSSTASTCLRWTFQSTRPRGARRRMWALSMPTPCFNPRARVGRDRLRARHRRSSGGFNPRARVGRDSARPQTSTSVCSFNPRARVGRDKSAPPGGCTAACFNPRARVGRDQSRRNGLPVYVRFNPRARVGRDPPSHPPCPCRRRFQSTRPRGARRLSGLGQGTRAHVSIHAPAWGATDAASGLEVRRMGFNPRARVGRDTAGDGRRRPAGVSIHAPAWGATIPKPTPLPLTWFQSTRPRGARPAAPGAEVSWW